MPKRLIELLVRDHTDHADQFISQFITKHKVSIKRNIFLFIFIFEAKRLRYSYHSIHKRNNDELVFQIINSK